MVRDHSRTALACTLIALLSSGSEEGFYPSGSDNESDAELTWEDQLENKYLETKGIMKPAQLYHSRVGSSPDEVGEEIECQNPNREKLVELIDDLKEAFCKCTASWSRLTQRAGMVGTRYGG